MHEGEQWVLRLRGAGGLHRGSVLRERRGCGVLHECVHAGSDAVLEHAGADVHGADEWVHGVERAGGVRERGGL